LSQDVEANGQTFDAGEGYVVPLDQPQGRFVKAAMERTSTYPDSIFYDVSTWTLPLAFGVDHASLTRDTDELEGAELSSVAYDGGAVEGGRSDYAYVFRWDRYYAPRAVRRLQRNDIRPRVMTDPFTAQVGGGTSSFNRGSIVVQVQQRGVAADSVHAAVQRIADHDHLRVYAVDQGLTPTGPDLGGASSEILERPKVALLTGAGDASGYGTSAYNAGEVWHLLNERMRVPVSLIDIEDVGEIDLSQYNTMVLAGGGYSGLPADAVQAWVEDGGTLIGIQSGSEWAVEQEMVSLEERSLDVDSLLQDRPYADLPNSYGAQGIGGSIFEVRLDPTHPVAYGYDETVAVFRSGTTFYDPSTAPGASVGTYTETPRLSGYVSEEQLDQARGAASIEAHEQGSGQVVLFMDNPNFRAFWYGTNGLFLNAVFFGQLL
jgi:hypothetical protein